MKNFTFNLKKDDEKKKKGLFEQTLQQARANQIQSAAKNNQQKWMDYVNKAMREAVSATSKPYTVDSSPITWTKPTEQTVQIMRNMHGTSWKDYADLMEEAKAAWSKQRPADISTARKAGVNISTIGGDSLPRTWQEQEAWDRQARASGNYDSPKYMNEQGVGLMTDGYIQSELDRLAKEREGRQTATDEELKYIRDTFKISSDEEAQRLWHMAVYNTPAFTEEINANNWYTGLEMKDYVTNILGLYDRNNPVVDKNAVDLNKAQTRLLENEQQRRAATNEFYANPDVAAVRAMSNYNQLRAYMPNSSQGEMWSLYEWLNNPGYREEQRQLNMRTQMLSNGTISDGEDLREKMGYGYWTADEIADFNAILWSQGEEAADRYADSLMATGMPQRRRAYEQVETYREISSDPLGAVVMNTVAAGANFAAGIQYPGQVFAKLFGDDDPNSYVNDMNRLGQVPRQTIGQNLYEWGQSWGGDIGGTLAQGAYNLSNILLDMQIARGLGGAKSAGRTVNPELSKNITLAIMGSQAGSNTMYNELEEGSSPEKAVLNGALAAGISSFVEKFSLDKFMKNPGTGLRYALQNFVTEGFEEDAEDMLNLASDVITSGVTGESNELQRVYDNAMLETKDAGKATNAVIGHFVKKLATDFILGGFAGGLSSIPGAVSINAQNTQTGQRLQENEYTERLLQMAESMPEDSESRKLANKINKRLQPLTKVESTEQTQPTEAVQEQQEAEPEQEVQAEQVKPEKKSTTPPKRAEIAEQQKTAATEDTEGQQDERVQPEKVKKTPPKRAVRNAQLGQLYRTLYQDLDAQGQETLAKTMEGSVRSRLAELGEPSESINEVVPPLTKLLGDGKLTNAEKRLIANSPHGLEVFNEIRFAKDEPGSTEWVNKAEQAAADVTDATEAALTELDTMMAPPTRVNKKAVDAAKRDVEIKGHAVKNAAEGTEQRMNVTVEDDDGQQVAEILRISGNSAKDGLTMMIRGPEGQEKEVNWEDVKFNNKDTATIVDYIANNEELLTVEEANKMVQTYTGGDVQEHISNYTVLYNAGYMGRSLPSSKLPQAQVIYDMGKQDAQQAEQNRVANVGRVKRTHGTLTLENGIDESTLSDNQKASVAALRTLAGASTMDIVLFESKADEQGNYKDVNGRYSSKTNTIYIDINSGKNSKDDIAQYAMLRTAGHEITHFIEHNSASGYAALKKYAIAEFRRRGLDYGKLVDAKLNSRAMGGERLTRNGAEAEVLADAMEMMLQDSKAIERLAAQDKSLYEQVKSVVVDYFRKVRDAFKGVTPAHDEAYALMKKGSDGLYHYSNRMIGLWDKALVEAVETVQGKAETTEQMSDPVDQFALRNTVEQRKDGLIAVHNLSASKFMDTLQLGGFPMPSIAIIKAEQGHDMYGDISVVFGPESIDPQANKANRVYGNDAWTPTFPHVEREIDSDELYKAEMDIEEAANKVDAELGEKSRMFFNKFGGTDVTSKKMEDIFDSAWNNQGVLAAYLTESGKPVEVLTKEVDAERPYNPAKAQQYDMILDIIDTTDYATMPMYEFLNTYGDKLGTVSDQMARLNAYWKNDDRRAGASMARIIKEAIEYEGAGRDVSEKKTTVKDFYATRKAMEAKADRAEFDAWIAQKLSSAFGQQGIYNGKDRFTPSGNRRSFKQTHYEYNVENVVRSMLQEQESAIPAVNASGLKAAASSRYGSLDDIRSDAYRLGKVSEEQFNALMAKADNDLHDFFNAIEAWDYDVEEKAGNLLVKAAKQKLNASGIAKLFKANGFTKATVNAAKIAENVIKQVQTIPTGYFEAKPARVVSFDEVRMVVAPDTMPVKLANMLDERGIPYTTYDGSEADRLEKLNAVEDVQFSPREINDPQLRKDASLVTDADVKAMLQMCKSNTAKNDTSIDASYIPLKKNTPEYLLKIAEAKQAPLIMQVQKARQAMAPENMKFGSSHGHAMTPDEIVQCLDSVNSPEYVGYNYIKDRIAVVVNSPVDDRPVVVLFDFKSNKNPEEMNSYQGGTYNVVVTMFKRNETEETIQYLESEKSGYIEKPFDEEASAADVPALSNQKVSENSILQTAGIDNPSAEENFQESPREVTGQLNMWDYMAEMEATAAQTGEEAAALTNYKRVMGELRQAIADRNQYREELKNAATPTERGKALNSLQVATKRLDRAYTKLNAVMNTKGMKAIEERSTAFVKEYLDGKTLQDVAELINAEEAEIKRLAGKNEKEAQKHREIVRQLRSKATENLLKEREKFHDMMDRNRELNKLTVLIAKQRKRLAKNVMALDNLIRHETDYKHVPEELKPFVVEFVSSFVDDGKGAGLVFRLGSDKYPGQARKLASIYRKLKTVEGGLHNEDIQEMLDSLDELLEEDIELRQRKNKNLEEIKEDNVRRLDIMEALGDLSSYVHFMVKKANNLFYAGKKAQFAVIGTEAVKAMEQRGDYKRLKGKAGENIEAADSFIRTGNMTPVYFFDRLKNKVFKTLYGDMLKAQEEYAFRILETRRFLQENKRKHNYNAWANDAALTMTTEKGKKLTLDKEDALSAYATWKREHADEMLPSYHMEEGGIVLEGNQMQDSDKKHLVAVRTTPTTLTANDMQKIFDYLTEEQKAYADDIVEYMSTTMAEYGNETSMALYGIKKYKESYYFPMKSAGDQLYQKSTMGGGQVTDDNRVKHRSFTKARVRGAATAIVLGKFSTVAAMHMEQMILYSTMTMPIESMNRVLNYKHQFEDGSKTTVRALMEQKYGPVMKRYMETFLSDMNGGIRRDSREAGLNKLVSLFKRGSVLASASVVVQQPTAIARATAMISPKYLIATAAQKPDYEELKQHSGVAILKDMGKFDVDMGAMTAEWLLEEDEGSFSAWQKVKQAANVKDFETFKKRWNTWMTWAPGKADEMTWAWLWRAVKAEQAQLHPEMNTGSDAFLDMCGERFNDIVNHTQVYDSTLTRSQNMRSKSGMMQMLTSFMSEPTLTANMLYDAVSNRERGKKYAVRAVTAALVSQILTSLAQALVSAGRDEDEKKTWAEKYAGKAAGNLASNLNPMNMLPLLRDIQSLLDGYDVTRADMSIFTEIVKAFDKLDSKTLSPYRKVEELGGSLAKLFGVPLKNLMRDARALVTTFAGNASRATSGLAVSEAIKEELLPWYTAEDSVYYERLYNAMASGNQQEANDLRDYLVTVLGKKESKINTEIRDELEKKVLDGTVGKDEAIQWLVKHGLKDTQREAFRTVDEWIDTEAHKDEEDYSHSMYGDFLDSIPNGGSKMTTAAKELLKYGVDKKTIASEIAKRYKDELIDLYKKGKASTLFARLLSAYEAIGYDRDYEMKYIKKNWLGIK